MSEIYKVHKDGEEIHYYDPVVTFVQGSLADERRESTGRIGKDRKEFKKVNALNSKFRTNLYEIFSSEKVTNPDGTKAQNASILEKRLSHLGASYPNIPGLGLYVSGLKNLEGKGQGKKIFDLLFWISSNEELECYWKYIILEPLGRLVLNLNIEGKWIQNSTTIFLMMGMNRLAFEVGSDILQNKSAIADSLKNGRKLAKSITINFYQNTRAYQPKIRRRGYARSSPVRPGSSKKEVQEANTSLEYLTESGILKSQEGGGYAMEEKRDLNEIIFNTFKNSLEAFELYQQELLARKYTLEKNKDPSSPEDKIDKQHEGSST